MKFGHSINTSQLLNDVSLFKKNTRLLESIKSCLWKTAKVSPIVWLLVLACLYQEVILLKMYSWATNTHCFWQTPSFGCSSSIYTILLQLLFPSLENNHFHMPCLSARRQNTENILSSQTLATHIEKDTLSSQSGKDMIWVLPRKLNFHKGFNSRITLILFLSEITCIPQMGHLYNLSQRVQQEGNLSPEK